MYPFQIRRVLPMSVQVVDIERTPQNGGNKTQSQQQDYKRKDDRADGTKLIPVPQVAANHDTKRKILDTTHTGRHM